MVFLAENFQTILISGMTTAGLVLIFLPIARVIGLVDKPDLRKAHVGDIPWIGGLCIFLSSVVTIFFLQCCDDFSVFVLGSGFLMLTVGILDDVMDLKPQIKLLLQLVITSAAVHLSGLKITTLGTIFGVPWSLELGFLSLPFTVVAVVGLTNAFNMIDGCDGLAGGLSLLAICGILALGAKSMGPAMTLVLTSLASGILVFLCFNMLKSSKFKIFLGDSGSLFLGYSIAWILIYSIEREGSFTPSLALWIVLTPLFDFLLVLIFRLRFGHSVMRGDRSHIHHLLISYGLAHQKTTALILFVSTVLLTAGIYVEWAFPDFSLPIFILLFTCYLLARRWASRHNSLN